MEVAADRPVIASEAEHWYDRTGAPAYAIIGKNGKERATTLRDARTLCLVPSVTKVIGLAAKPGLEAWKQRQVLLASLTLPRVEGESDAALIGRIIEDSREQAKKAAARGTAIHAAIAQGLRGEQHDPALNQHVGMFWDAVRAEFGHVSWAEERSFAHPLGFGGAVDLHRVERDPLVLDIKSKDSPEQAELYDEHAMQLAAYANGLGIPGAECAIVFVGRGEPWAIVKRVEPEKIVRGWTQFQALLGYFYATTGLGAFKRESVAS